MPAKCEQEVRVFAEGKVSSKTNRIFQNLILVTVIGRRPKSEFCFLSGRLKWTPLPKERYGDSLSGCGPNSIERRTLCHLPILIPLQFNCMIWSFFNAINGMIWFLYQLASSLAMHICIYTLSADSFTYVSDQGRTQWGGGWG